MKWLVESFACLPLIPFDRLRVSGFIGLLERLKKHLLLLLTLTIFTSTSAKVTFGNKQSTLFLNDNSSWNIVPVQVTFDGGSLNNSGFGKLLGGNIRFKRGNYTFFNSSSDLDGELNPNFNTIKLGNSPYNDGDTMISNPGGLAAVQINAVPGSNILRGQPLFFGAQDVTLQDDMTVLAVAIQNTLNTNIKLNGGTLFLQDDLRLGDDAIIEDDGLVVLNKRRFSLGGHEANWAGTILWDHSQDLQLNSTINLSGIWGFVGDGQINGNGNVINIADGGRIVVLPNSTLRLSSLQIKGLGPGKIILAPTATLKITDVKIGMDDNYQVDSGIWYVEGSSEVITGAFILEFVAGASSNGQLVVDNVPLSYNTLASIDNTNIRPLKIQDPASRFIKILGNGQIGYLRLDVISVTSYRTTSTLQRYAIVAPYRKFDLFPEVRDDLSLNYDVVMDGNTNFIGFTYTEQPVFRVTAGVHATTTNVVMRDFSPNHLQLDAGASLLFGDMTMISLARNERLNYRWRFSGKTILRGTGQVLELGPLGEIVLEGENSELLLDGITIKGISGNKIRCESPTSTIKMRQVRWLQNGNYTFATGAISLIDDVTLNTPYRFIYTSVQPFAVMANATLSVSQGAGFIFSPTDGNTTNFTFEDQTAVLSLDQAVFGAPRGVTLANGRFVVRGINYQVGTFTRDKSMLPDTAGAVWQTISS